MSSTSARARATAFDARLASPHVFTIAMVLPRQEEDDELAFKRYLSRHGVAARYQMVRFSGQPDDGPALVRAVRQAHPDLIYSWGTPTTLALAGRFDGAPNDGHIRDIPIVFVEVTDPVGVGLLPSLEAPSRNLTGVPHIAPFPTQIALLQSYRPFTRIGFIDNPLEANSTWLRHRLQTLARDQGLEVLVETLHVDATRRIDADSLANHVDALKSRGAQVLYIGASTLLAFTLRDQLTQAALKAGLPTFCTTESILRQSNCLYGIFSDGNNIGRYAGYKAQRILVEHRAPASIAATPLQRFSILVNLRVAKQLDLFPPLSLLQVAEVRAMGSHAAASTP